MPEQTATAVHHQACDFVCSRSQLVVGQEASATGAAHA